MNFVTHIQDTKAKDKRSLCGLNRDSQYVVFARRDHAPTCKTCRRVMGFDPSAVKRPARVSWEERVRDYFGAISR